MPVSLKTRVIPKLWQQSSERYDTLRYHGLWFDMINDMGILYFKSSFNDYFDIIIVSENFEDKPLKFQEHVSTDFSVIFNWLIYKALKADFTISNTRKRMLENKIDFHDVSYVLT